MIDAAIPLQGQGPNVPPMVGQLVSLKNAGIQQQGDQELNTLRGQAIQQGQYSLAQAGQDQQDNADVRASMAAATDPQTGQMDRGVLLSTLGKLNPYKAAQTAATLTAQDTASQEAQAKLQKAQMDAATAHVEAKDRLLQGVSDQATYTNALQQGQALGIVKPGELPTTYDPQLVAQLHAQTLSQKDVLAQQQQASDLAEKTRNDTLTAQSKEAAIPLATQATRIYAIPAAQRTPEQNAFITGYEKNNDVTKIQPAAVRMNTYLQMPQAIVDPNDPSREIYTTRAKAVGQEAPASGEAAGARKVVTSAIGGKLGDTINSYNTANAHLDMLSQAADALYNGNIKVLNQIGNEYNQQTGSPAPTNFQAVKSAVSGEVSKTFKGGQATDAEIKQFDDAISSANSPKQLQGVIATYKGLMNSKKEAIQQQVQQGAQGKVNFQQGTVTMKSPNGQTKAVSADQVDHYKALGATVVQ